MIRKQFIAGAVCPQCQAVDKVQWVREVGEAGELIKSHHECVSCGFLRLEEEFEQWGSLQDHEEQISIDKAQPVVIKKSSSE